MKLFASMMETDEMTMVPPIESGRTVKSGERLSQREQEIMDYDYRLYVLQESQDLFQVTRN